MKQASNVILRIVVCLAIFIAVMFFVAWLLEDVIYFSLFSSSASPRVSSAH